MPAQPRSDPHARHHCLAQSGRQDRSPEGVTKHRNAEHKRGWRVTERVGEGTPGAVGNPSPIPPWGGGAEAGQGHGRGRHGHSSPGS